MKVTTSSDYESGRSRLLTRAANEATRLNTQNTGKITSFGKMGELAARPKVVLMMVTRLGRSRCERAMQQVEQGMRRGACC